MFGIIQRWAARALFAGTVQWARCLGVPEEELAQAGSDFERNLQEGRFQKVEQARLHDATQLARLDTELVPESETPPEPASKGSRKKKET